MADCVPRTVYKSSTNTPRRGVSPIMLNSKYKHLSPKYTSDDEENVIYATPVDATRLQQRLSVMVERPKTTSAFRQPLNSGK